MNIHNNARLTPKGRELLVQRIVVDGLRPQEAAQAAGVSPPTAYKWLRRYPAEGLADLQDRSSRSPTCPHATSLYSVPPVEEAPNNPLLARLAGFSLHAATVCEAYQRGSL